MKPINHPNTNPINKSSTGLNKIVNILKRGIHQVVSSPITDNAYLVHIPGNQEAIKDYFMSLDQGSKDYIKNNKIINYKPNSIVFSDESGKIIAELEYEDITVSDSIVREKKEITSTANTVYNNEPQTYISYNIADLSAPEKEYGDARLEEYKGITYGNLEGWKRYITAANIELPSIEQFKAMVEAMPAKDRSEAIGQLFGLLGAKHSAYRSGGRQMNDIPRRGFLISNTRQYGSGQYGIHVDEFGENNLDATALTTLIPARALKKN